MINLFLLDVCKHLTGVKLSIYMENSCQSNKKVISKIAKCQSNQKVVSKIPMQKNSVHANINSVLFLFYFMGLISPPFQPFIILYCVLHVCKHLAKKGLSFLNIESYHLFRSIGMKLKLIADRHEKKLRRNPKSFGCLYIKLNHTPKDYTNEALATELLGILEALYTVEAYQVHWSTKHSDCKEVVDLANQRKEFDKVSNMVNNACRLWSRRFLRVPIKHCWHEGNKTTDALAKVCRSTDMTWCCN